VNLSTAVRSSAVAVYPNPTDGKAVIEGSDIAAGDAITVITATGTPALQLKADGSRTSLDLSALPKGLYIIRINGQAIKIIKNR